MHLLMFMTREMAKVIPPGSVFPWRVSKPTRQFNSIQFNSIQFNAIQFNSIQAKRAVVANRQVRPKGLS